MPRPSVVKLPGSHIAFFIVYKNRHLTNEYIIGVDVVDGDVVGGGGVGAG
ncbi:hypothetical protein GCM10027436_87950 [Actinophytocola sediminis]